MRRPNRIMLALAATLALQFGCSEEAVVGDTTDPISCLPNNMGGGAMEGTILGANMDPIGEVFYDDSDGIGVINLVGPNRESLQIVFSCAIPTSNPYSIIHPSDNSLPEYCRNGDKVAQASFYQAGSLNPTIAEAGTVVIDEAAGCVAGSFSLDFESGDSVTGWFSIAN